MNIGIVGSRRRTTKDDFNKVKDAFDKIYQAQRKDWIISGGCPEGGDNFAKLIARYTGCPILIFHANWKRYGRQAGFLRNWDIAKNSDILIACVAPDRKGGTEDTIKKFKGELILV